LSSGLALGGLAALVGMADLLLLLRRPAKAEARQVAQPEDTSAVDHALWHAGAAITAVGLFLLALLLRQGGAGSTASPSVLGLELLGALTLLVTGWLGGHLVFHHRIGVDSAEPRLTAGHQPRRRKEAS
jgi:uncharacterized membrane protein